MIHESIATMPILRGTTTGVLALIGLLSCVPGPRRCRPYLLTHGRTRTPSRIRPTGPPSLTVDPPRTGVAEAQVNLAGVTRSVPATNFTVSVARLERRVTVRGELDVAAVFPLSDATTVLLMGCPGDSVLDVSRLTFVDAAGLGQVALLASELGAQGAQLAIEGATPWIRRVFALGLLGDLLAAP